VWTSLVPNRRDAFQYLATKFFEYFLDSYNIAISVGPLTLCSAHFWEGRILTSFTQEHVEVYKCDEDKIEIIPNWLEFQLQWSEFIHKSSEGIDEPCMILISKNPPAELSFPS